MIPNINNKRGDAKPPQKKFFNLKTCKKNTFKSLNDVNYFLNNIKKINYYFKIYKLFK